MTPCARHIGSGSGAGWYGLTCGAQTGSCAPWWRAMRKSIHGTPPQGGDTLFPTVHQSQHGNVHAGFLLSGDLVGTVADLHLVASGRAQQSDIKVEVGGLLQATVVHGAGRCQPDHHLHQVCTGTRRHSDKGICAGKQASRHLQHIHELAGMQTTRVTSIHTLA